MIIKVKKYIESKKKMLEYFKSHSEYLEEGEYKIDDLLTYLYKNDSLTYSTVSNMLENSYTRAVFKKSILKRLLNLCIKILFFNKTLIVKESSRYDSIFQGNLYLPSMSGKEIKIFDLNTNRVLLIFSNKKDYINRVKKYNRFQEYFNLPKILSKNDSDLMAVEKYIDYKPNFEWTNEDYEKVIKNAFKTEIEYIKLCKNSGDYYYKNIKQITEELPKMTDFIDFLKKNIKDELLEEEFPYVQLHGDLWTSNILVENNKKSIYYIDWEYSTYFIIIYDFCFMILNESFTNSNNLYLDNYIDGKYDKYFDKIFEIFDMKMKTEYRIDYLYMAMLLQYLDRWYKVGYKIEMKILKNIKGVFEYINNIKSY
ncbi:phosphotransferase [Senegalia massiliensis]|uniref:Aminoglycoside phosphotransferase domain-containing protein n=1 Tax=Senegalia massiliensis TaxID=1720316 RepID=A0A845R3H7_9CLOT|nr:phosphotransferase [Senegalia massiliensis]NBI07992.1 hypothetical protein [Senegalia massiliensis]